MPNLKRYYGNQSKHNILAFLIGKAKKEKSIGGFVSRVVERTCQNFKHDTSNSLEMNVNLSHPHYPKYTQLTKCFFFFFLTPILWKFREIIKIFPIFFVEIFVWKIRVIFRQNFRGFFEDYIYIYWISPKFRYYTRNF
jgi:hypothetical protein